MNQFEAESGISDIILAADGPSLGFILEDEEAEQRLFKYASTAAACIFGRLAPNHKAQISEVAKYFLKYKIIAIGDGNNDTPML